MDKRNVLWTLAAVNLLLAAAFVWQQSDNWPARAQGREGEYTMIPAKVSGQADTLIYLLDSENDSLGGVIYNESRRESKAIEPVDMKRIFDK
jgi:hypothetical protein